MTVTPLHRELESFGRTARRLGRDTVLAHSRLLPTLAGRELASDPQAAIELADWTVQTLRTIIAAFSSGTDRAIATAILAADSKLHDKTVEARLATLRDDGYGYAADAFKRRRSGVLARLADELERAYQRSTAPIVFLSGRYVNEHRDRHLADELGTALADLPIRLFCGGSILGAHIAEAFFTARAERGEPTDNTLFIRASSTRLNGIFVPSVAHVRVFDTGRTQLRRIMLSENDIAMLLVFGGGDFGDDDGNGTGEEVAIGRDRGLPILPVTTSGGVAQSISAHERRRYAHTPLADAFDRLADPTTAAEATVELAAYILGRPATGTATPSRRVAGPDTWLREYLGGRRWRTITTLAAQMQMPVEEMTITLIDNGIEHALAPSRRNRTIHRTGAANRETP